LIAPALRLFDAIWKPGLGFQKCGIMLTNLVVADRTKRDLFEPCDPDRQLRLMRAVDALNWDYGARTVHCGYLGGPKPKCLSGRISSAAATRRRGPSYGLSVDVGMGFDRRGETS